MHGQNHIKNVSVIWASPHIFSPQFLCTHAAVAGMKEGLLDREFLGLPQSWNECRDGHQKSNLLLHVSNAALHSSHRLQFAKTAPLVVTQNYFQITHFTIKHKIKILRSLSQTTSSRQSRVSNFHCSCQKHERAKTGTLETW